MMVSNDRPLKQTIGTDRSAAIEAGKHEIRALEQELARNKNEEKAVGDEVFKSKKAWNEAQVEYNKLNKKIKQMQSTLDDLRAEAETSEDVPTIDTSDLENDVREAEESVEDMKKKEAAIVQEIESLQPEIDEHKRRLDEITARNEKVCDDLEMVEAKLEDIVKGHACRMELVEKMRAKVAQHEESLNQQEALLQDQKEKVAKALHGARKMTHQTIRDKKKLESNKSLCGLVDEVEIDAEPSEEDLEAIDIIIPEKDSKYFMTKIVNKEKKIEAERERRNMSEVDPAVAREKYLRAHSKMRQIDAITKNTQDLRHDLKDRKKRWRQFRSHIAEMTNIAFDEFLNKKGSAGEVEFDHERQQLNLIVQKVWFDPIILSHTTSNELLTS